MNIKRSEGENLPISAYLGGNVRTLALCRLCDQPPEGCSNPPRFVDRPGLARRGVAPYNPRFFAGVDTSAPSCCEKILRCAHTRPHTEPQRGAYGANRCEAAALRRSGRALTRPTANRDPIEPVRWGEGDEALCCRWQMQQRRGSRAAVILFGRMPERSNAGREPTTRLLGRVE